jgi:hypothetical protein
MNTSHEIVLAPARAEELAGLLDGLLSWLCAGDRRALADLEHHLAGHAVTHGGTFDSDHYHDATHSILDGFTALIAAYAADLDRPDYPEEDLW